MPGELCGQRLGNFRARREIAGCTLAVHEAKHRSCFADSCQLRVVDGQTSLTLDQTRPMLLYMFWPILAVICPDGVVTHLYLSSVRDRLFARIFVLMIIVVLES